MSELDQCVLGLSSYRALLNTLFHLFHGKTGYVGKGRGVAFLTCQIMKLRLKRGESLVQDHQPRILFRMII